MQTEHPTRSLKEKQRQEREELILQVAEEVLLEKGYYEASIDEIAARVGIAKGTVYLHFPGKEDLVIAIFNRTMDRFLQESRKALEPLTTPRAKLEKLLYCMYAGMYRKSVKLLYSAYNSLEMQRLFQAKQEKVQTLSAYVTALLEEGKAVGEFDAALPTSVMHAAFFSLLSPKSYERLTDEEHIPPAELAKHLSSLYFKGITEK